LTPNFDLVGGDLWTFVATYLVNTVINIFLITSALMTMLATPLVAFVALHTMTDNQRILALVATTVSLLMLLLVEHRYRVKPSTATSTVVPESFAHYAALVSYAFTLVLLSGVFNLIPASWLKLITRAEIISIVTPRASHIWWLVALGTLMVLFTVAYSRGFVRLFVYLRKKFHWLRLPTVVIFSAVLLITALFVTIPYAVKIVQQRIIVLHMTEEVGTFIFGTVAGFIWLTMVVTGVLAVAGGHVKEVTREWLMWLVGRWLLVEAIMLGISSVAFIGPILVRRNVAAIRVSAIVVAVLLLVAQMYLRARPPGGISRTLIVTCFRLATAIWAGLVLCVIAYLNMNFVLPKALEGDAVGYWQCIRDNLNGFAVAYWVILLAISLLSSWRTGNNRFSMHAFYRNRIIQCYLGPSRRASPQSDSHEGRFSSFDDFKLTECASKNYFGPYPIFNAALNVSTGEDLSWQDRKACSFIFAPLYCGFEARRAMRRRGRRHAFVGTSSYAYDNGISAGHAMAISGAAVSPHMGYQSSRSLSFFMTTLNLRLGWWLPNPWVLGDARPRRVLRNRPFTLCRELFGFSDDTAEDIYLSDGGHFENLGVYELIRRRCRVIIAVDAGQDRDLSCQSLASAVEKCRVDFGVDIVFGRGSIPVGDKDGDDEGKPWALGQIEYSKARLGPDGIIVYVKASGGIPLPWDVESYGKRHASFPQESTMNQWFSETRFESYRALGEHIIRATIRQVQDESGADLLRDSLRTVP
jgi:hypothetical protein